MTSERPAETYRSCPSGEFLVAAVTGGVNDDEQRWLDTHLDSCDRCLDAVDTALRRLRIADEIPVAVPDAVHQRAATAAAMSESAPTLLPGPQPATDRPASTTWPATRWPATQWLATWWRGGARGWVAALLRPPVMIPAAVGLVAVLALATQMWMTPGVPRSLTRSIAVPQHVRVTALEAPVRRRPSGNAEIVATVARGTVVDISGEERDWLHVTLPDGTEGWVDQTALR